MELSQSTQEVITQAQMLRLATNGSVLCREHLFYGLLLMACYKEEPMNAQEYRQEARKLRAFLEGWVLSIASAKRQLKQDAETDDSLFTDAKAILGRAAEMAGENEITPMDLARAIRENQSPTIRALSGLRIPDALREDDLYHPEQAKARKEQDEAAPLRGAGQISDIRPASKPEPASAPKPVQQPKPSPEPERAPVQEQKPEKNEYERIAEMLRQLDRQELNPKNRQKQEKNAGRQEKQRNRVVGQRRKKRTKVGLITWHGGPIAACIQYLLTVLLIPAAALYALEHFTGYVTAPPTPWAEFGIRMFILLAVFLTARALIALIRAITVTAGGAGQSVSLFLRGLADLGLIAGIMQNVGKVFFGAGLTSPDFPNWLKIVGGVAAVFTLSACVVLYGALNYTEQQKRKKIKYGNSEGRVGQVMLRNLTSQLLFPTAVLTGLWAYTGTLEDWQVKTFWILGFIIAWSIPNNIISCISLAAEAPWYRGGGKGFFRFLRAFYTFMFIPLLVLFLHWLFGWFPMQLWVMIVLGVYLLITLLGSVIYARN